MSSKSEHRRSHESKEICDETTPLIPIKQNDCRLPQPSRQASVLGAVFNLSTTIVGAGMMALPATMKLLGLVPGVLMITFVAFLTDASIEMLIRSSRAAKKSTYAGVMGDAFRKVGRRLLQTLVVINNLGLMIIYMIIIGEQMVHFSSSHLVEFHLAISVFFLCMTAVWTIEK